MMMKLQQQRIETEIGTFVVQPLARLESGHTFLDEVITSPVPATAIERLNIAGINNLHIDKFLLHAASLGLSTVRRLEDNLPIILHTQAVDEIKLMPRP